MEEGLNFKQVIQKIKTLTRYLISKWKAISIISVLGALIGFYIGKTSIAEYRATSTFMINSSKGGGQLSSIIGMASSLGIGLGGSSMSIENVSEVVVSDRIVLNSLLKKQKIEGKETCLGNYYIDQFGLRDKWIEKDKPYKDYKFSGSDAFNLTNEEYKLATIILGNIKGLINVDFEKQSNIVTISCKSRNQVFSFNLTKTLIDELTTFYINRTTKNERETFNILSSKTDSIKNVLQKAEVELAKLKDNSFKTVKAVGRLQEMQLEREIGILSVMYSTSVSNVEMARVNLLQKKPFIQIIDQPILPLRELKKSPVVFGIMLMVLFGFLTTLFFVVKHEVALSLKE